MLVGGATLYMLGYLECRNDIIFNNIKHSSFMQVVFRGPISCTCGHTYSMEIRQRRCFERRSLALKTMALKIGPGGITSGLVYIFFL